ncbi:MAG TPA: hypothetical protein VFP20_07735, partial [Bacteroidales bacterium]|nr:hypothetical protein [Bacteroidales bacterium]
DRGGPIAKHWPAVVWVVLGPVNFKTIGLKKCFSRVADSVSAARHQPGTVQTSADSQIMFVAKIPHF